MLTPNVHEVANSYHEEWTEADRLAEQAAIEDALTEAGWDIPDVPTDVRATFAAQLDAIDSGESIGTLGFWRDDA